MLKKRFNGFYNALGAFAEHKDPEAKDGRRRTAEGPQKPTRKVKGGAKRRGARRFGKQISFGPMVYAPTSENGVIFLFALVAGELGFAVERIHPSFPDCEAKRHIGDSEELNPCEIEFEYKSSNYRSDHPHDWDGIIVCWLHDWKECPDNIEVIELREAIKEIR